MSYPSGSVLNLKKLNCSGTVGCYADGYDVNTVRQLQYVSDRFGPVSSWSSAYRTDTWNLNIERKSGEQFCMHEYGILSRKVHCVSLELGIINFCRLCSNQLPYYK